MPSPIPTSFWAAPWRRWLLGLLAFALLWTGVVGWWLPSWLRPRIEQAASEALGTPVRLAVLDILPWRGVVRVSGLRVGPAEAPMLTAAQVEAQASLESLWRLAPVLRRVRIDQPVWTVVRESPERFNFSDVLDKLTAVPATPPPPSEPARFAVFNIVLDQGRIRYVDRVLHQEHELAQLHIGVPFLSNLSSFIEADVKPQLTAQVDGSPVNIQGELLPFQADRRSVVHLKWDALDVPHWLAAAQPLLPAPWRMQASEGRLSLDLTLRFEARSAPALPVLSVEGGLVLDKLALSLPNAPGLGRVDAAWQALRVDGLAVQPLARQFKVAKLRLEGARWQSQAAAARGAASQPAQPAAQAGPETGSAWGWQVGDLDLQAVRVAVRDAANRAWPAITDLRVRVQGLSSAAQAKPARWQVSAKDEHAASLQAQGQVQLASQTVAGQLQLTQAQLAPWLAPLQAAQGWPLTVAQGQLDAQAQVQARLKPGPGQAPAQATLTQGQLTLSQARAHTQVKGLGDFVQARRVALNNIDARLALGAQPGLQSASADQLAVEQLQAAVTRGAAGEWLGMQPTPTATPAVPAAGGAGAAVALPALHLHGLRCSDCALRFKDLGAGEPVSLEVHQTQLQLTDLDSDLSRPVGLSLQTLAQGKGQLRLTGSLKPQPLALDARVQLTGLELRALQPYLAPHVNVTLAGAKAAAQGQLALRLPPGQAMAARYTGKLGLGDVRVLDRLNDAEFLSWKSLTLDKAKLALQGDALDADFGQIGLQQFYGRLIVNPSGKLNLAGILKQAPDEATRSLTTPETRAPADTPAPAADVQAMVRPPEGAAEVPRPAPKLRWQLVRLGQGRVDFTDNYIQPHYSARLTQIEGEVSAVSSERPDPATLRLSGAVDDAAPLQITGQLNPLGPRLFTDIEGEAKGIELTRLTPYAARYAGYAIDKGALSVKVHYKVDNGKLEASNNIFLDQLTFGEKTDSPDAIKLPVLFAVSLLKNSRGEIDVNLPISGSLDDPQFSVGGIIWRVVLNLITKAVTAPFALLAGGGSEELGFVPFDPGQAQLTDLARQRLDTLATKLADRPALKLQATGRADPVVDAEGLRKVYLDGLLRAAKARATGEAADALVIDAKERGTWLHAAYQAADIKKPRNFIGIAKTLPDAEMAALLEAAAPTGADALRALANARADQVKAYLSRRLPPERILLTASKVAAAPAGEDAGSPARVQFEIK